MVDDDEIINAANRFFKKVGSAVKTAGTTAVKAGKTVTGVGRGSVRVIVDAPRARAGGDLRGKIALDLPEPVDAKRLIVTLRASQRGTELRGGVRTPISTTLYRFEHEVAGARRYAREELAFTLPIPRDIATKPEAPAGKLGDVARAVSAVASVVSATGGPIEWRVTASLVIAFGRDLEHSLDIVVS